MRLPPVRALAIQLGVNQITVAKAFRGLADAKLVEGRRGGGSFVRSHTRQYLAITNPGARCSPSGFSSWHMRRA